MFNIQRFSTFLLCIMFIFGCSKKEETKELILGFNPAENTETFEVRSKILSEILEKKLGYKIKTFVAGDFGALVEAMRSGNVHLAFLPPFSFIQAERVAGARVLLKAVRKGRPFYHSAIITAKDFNTVQDLKGKTMAWTDPSSASGHIMAKSGLMDLGIDPDTFFSKQIFAGGHDALIMSVLNGTVDAGATVSNDPEGKEGIWLRFVKDPEKLKKIKVLYVSKPVPGDTLSTTDKFYSSHKKLVDDFVEILKNLHASEDGKKVLYELYQIDSMIPAHAEEYEPLRVAAKRLNITQ